MLCRETNTRTWSSCDFVSVGAQSIVKRRCHTKETRTGTREQEEMRKSMWGTGRQEKSEKCQGYHRLEIDKCCHGSGRIVVCEVGRKACKGHTIEDIIGGMSKPVLKGDNFIQCRSHHKGSARGVSTSQNATTTRRGSASSSSTGHDGQEVGKA